LKRIDNKLWTVEKGQIKNVPFLFFNSAPIPVII
jgi:hypothetical protein